MDPGVALAEASVLRRVAAHGVHWRRAWQRREARAIDASEL